MARRGKRGGRKSGIGSVRYKSNAGFHGSVGVKGGGLDLSKRHSKRGKRK